MGSTGKKILPLVAMAAAAYFTGGAALSGYGSVAASGFHAGTAASTGFFSSVTASQVGLGIQGLQALSGMSAAQASADAQMANLAFQESQQRIQQSSDQLALAESELQSQRKVRRTLAAQNNMFAASGINPATGSARSLSEAIFAEAGAKQDSFAAQRSLLEARAINNTANLAARRRQTKSSGQLGGFDELLTFGGQAVD